MHFNLLIFSVVLFQASIGAISSKNIKKSSDLLVRNKRVINTEPGGDVSVRAGEFPFVVYIELHKRTHCVGSILSQLTVITSAFCASEEVSAYTIFSGSIFTYGGTERQVIAKKIRLGNYVEKRASDGVAIFIVASPIISRHTRVVALHTAPILTGTPATVAGWGCYYVPRVRGTEHPRTLRAITVPIMRHQECVGIYRGVYNITDEDVCIYDEHKHCGHTDAGAPLIINGELAGVYLRRGPRPLRRVPEIFAILQHAHYSQWINDNIVHNL